TYRSGPAPVAPPSLPTPPPPPPPRRRPPCRQRARSGALCRLFRPRVPATHARAGWWTFTPPPATPSTTFSTRLVRTAAFPAEDLPIALRCHRGLRAHVANPLRPPARRDSHSALRVLT